MPTRQPLHATLYELHQPGSNGNNGNARDSLDLMFFQCGACAALTFPATSYGCHHCGAAPDTGVIIKRPAEGLLQSFTTVHADLTPALKAPFVVGEIELAPGVVEEAILGVTTEAGLHAGLKMRGIAVPDTTQPDTFVCHFIPMEVQA